MKLQDAYAAESNQLGGWELIGYTAPGTKASTTSFSSTNFTYSSTADGGASVALTTTGATMDGGWIATATVALNDCAANSTWTMSVTGKTDGITYAKVYSDQTNCKPLTPNFENIGN